MTAGGIDRAQSTSLGFALLVGITMSSALVLVGMGSVVMGDTQTEYELAQAEQTMRLFDSQVAKVGIGDSPRQRVDFDGGRGSYTVDPSAGAIRITHLNYTGTGTNETVLPRTALGAVTYTHAGTTIAFQAGGVWRKDETGSARLLSPPNFQYRGATITFPITVTTGSGSTAGTGGATITQAAPARPVYANDTATYPNGAGYDNPVTEGRILIEIESDYATAWGAYFDARTEGEVTYPDDETVQVVLGGVGDLGPFDMPGEGGSITVPGAEAGHSVDEFTVTIRPDDTNAANFDNLQWALYAHEGQQQFELHLKKGSGSGCGDTPLTADATVYYSADGGTTYHGWHADDVYTAQCADRDGDGDEEIEFELSLVDDADSDGATDDVEAGDANLTYQELSRNELVYFNPGGATLAAPTIDGHSAAWEPTSPTAGSELTMDMLINHYFGELPNEFALGPSDQNSNTVNEDASFGTLYTTGTGKFVTYLHTSERHINVTLH